MREASFFQTTRGRIVESLRRRGGRTAADLSKEHGLTANGVRQHLSRLERDGLISELSERRGPTKPSFVYSLTPEGERLFPQRYHVLLNAVLDELLREGGDDRLHDVFRKIGERSAAKYASQFQGKDMGQRVAELTRILRKQGVVADYEATKDGFIVREHNCPFKEAATSHPQVCSVIHTLMQETLAAKPEHTTSIARGDKLCEFRIPLAATPTKQSTGRTVRAGDSGGR